jgi:DNA-binding IscR family transcriptional regulator
VPSHELAGAAAVPDRYLLKLLKKLVDVGLLDAAKGPHGCTD